MNKDLKYILILFFLCYFFFFLGNGLISLTSPDEVFYAQTAKEMAQHHSWMTPILFDQPQFEKPILLYWLLRVAYLIFGVTSSSARFFPACFALLGVIGVYFFSKLIFKEEKKGFVSALVLLSSCLYIGLARTVFTDMVFSVLIFFSLWSFYWGYLDERHKRTGIILFFIFSALAVLTKGPLGLVIPFLVVFVFLILLRRIKFIFCKDTIWGLLIFSAIALPWYFFVSIKYGPSFTHEFFYNDHYRRLIAAEHSANNTWYFYPLTVIGCMFPWSIFTAVAIFYMFRRKNNADKSSLFLACWFMITLLVFQFAHSKLTSYIFPMFPALAMICGNFIYDSLVQKERQRQFFVCSALTWFIALLILSGLLVFGFKFSHYLSSLRPVYFFISAFILWLAIAGLALLKNKYSLVLYLFVSILPLFMIVVPFIRKDIEPYLSSKYASEYLLNNYLPGKGSYLLCSKNFVRGTRFYTGMKVAVLGSSNFFSPHPVPFLSSDEEAGNFLRQQPLVYGFLKKSDLENLKRIAGKEFEYRLLKNIGDQYIVKIEK
jgi:4-amino-4-deoxy-L-arabinose transferase-like glycosyltransferase